MDNYQTSSSFNFAIAVAFVAFLGMTLGRPPRITLYSHGWDSKSHGSLYLKCRSKVYLSTRRLPEYHSKKCICAC